MDGGAWWSAVHGVAQSWTRLSDCTFTFHFHALEKEMAAHSSALAWRIPGTGSLVGCRLWGRTESDMTEVTQQQQQQQNSLFLFCFFVCFFQFWIDFSKNTEKPKDRLGAVRLGFEYAWIWGPNMRTSTRKIKGMSTLLERTVHARSTWIYLEMLMW